MPLPYREKNPLVGAELSMQGDEECFIQAQQPHSMHTHTRTHTHTDTHTHTHIRTPRQEGRVYLSKLTHRNKETNHNTAQSFLNHRNDPTLLHTDIVTHALQILCR